MMRDNELIAAYESELKALRKDHAEDVAKLSELTAAATALYQFDWRWQHGTLRYAEGSLWTDLRNALGLAAYGPNKMAIDDQRQEMRRISAAID